MPSTVHIFDRNELNKFSQVLPTIGKMIINQTHVILGHGHRGPTMVTAKYLGWYFRANGIS